MIRSFRTKLSLIWYLVTHKDMRCWQAIRNWSREEVILSAKFAQQLNADSDFIEIKDTFYREEK